MNLPENKNRTQKDIEPDIHTKGHFGLEDPEKVKRAQEFFAELDIPFGTPPKPSGNNKRDPDAAKENK